MTWMAPVWQLSALGEAGFAGYAVPASGGGNLENWMSVPCA